MSEPLSPDQFVPGTQVVVERRIGQNPRKCVTRVVGAYPPEYLLLEKPTLNTQDLLAPEDANCIVRFLQEGRAFGFRARVVAQQQTPLPLLIVTYPKTFQEVTVRQEERIGCGIAATLRTEAEPDNDAPPLAITLIDLSPNGCQLAVPLVDPDTPDEIPELREQRIPIQEREYYRATRVQQRCAHDQTALIDLELPPPWSTSFEAVVCKVQRGRPFRGYYLVGARFVAPSESFTAAVRQLIDYQLQYFSRPF